MPVIDRTICDADGLTNCRQVTECQEYQRNPGNAVPPTFHYVRSHPLKVCDGIFGVDSQTYAALRTYARAVNREIQDLKKRVEACENQ